MKLRIKTWLIAITILTFALMLGACSSIKLDTAPSDHLYVPVVYGTMKVIEERDEITADGVLRYVAYARTIIEQDLTVSAQQLAADLITQLLTEDLSPADKFLVQSLIERISIEVDERNARTPDDVVALAVILDWVETGARLAR